MKKSKLRSLIWIALVAISFASYTYLGKFAPEAEMAYSITDQTEEELEEEQTSKALLPDIALVKKLLNVTKIVLPND